MAIAKREVARGCLIEFSNGADCACLPLAPKWDVRIEGEEKPLAPGRDYLTDAVGAGADGRRGCKANGGCVNSLPFPSATAVSVFTYGFDTTKMSFKTKTGMKSAKFKLFGEKKKGTIKHV